MTGISQHELARQAGVAYSSINLFLTDRPQGTRKPNATCDWLDALYAVLNPLEKKQERARKRAADARKRNHPRP